MVELIVRLYDNDGNIRSLYWLSLQLQLEFSADSDTTVLGETHNRRTRKMEDSN